MRAAKAKDTLHTLVKNLRNYQIKIICRIWRDSPMKNIYKKSLLVDNKERYKNFNQSWQSLFETRIIILRHNITYFFIGLFFKNAAKLNWFASKCYKRPCVGRYALISIFYLGHHVLYERIWGNCQRCREG
jgi:hypothetical protein